jgi:D-aminoacyl-tRNA deacylase
VRSAGAKPLAEERYPGNVRFLVASEADEASMNQQRALLALAHWKETPSFEGRPAFRREDARVVTITDHHLYRNHLDRDLTAAFGEGAELVVYLSKHRSESRTPSLTVHPVGNAGDAELGGQPGTLVPAAPSWMTAALRRLRIIAKNLPYEVTFEATHHGPYLESPTFYIEQGSTEKEWADPEAAIAIARTLLDLRPVEAPVALGLGGGHYAPRHTDVALARQIAFGHLLPSHALEKATEDLLAQAIDCTPGASLAYLHRKSLGKPMTHILEAWLSHRGLRVVHEADLASWEDKGS